MTTSKTIKNGVWSHILLWSCFISVPFLFNVQGFWSAPKLLVIRISISALVFYVNYALLVPYLLLKRKTLPYVGISLAFLVSITLILANVIPQIEFPKELMEFQPKDWQGPPVKTLKYFAPAIFSFTFFLLGGSFALVKYFRESEKKAATILNEKREMELQFLRNQLNPHFLFNSLNSIYSLVRDKSDAAPDSVLSLSGLMRYMLYEAQNETVLLSKEIDYIIDYVALQRLRLVSSEKVILDIEGNYESRRIHPLILISFVENAFKYGANPNGEQDVYIKLSIIDDVLDFVISNEIGRVSKATESSGIGLENIKKRLLLLYKDNHSLRIERTQNRYNVHLTLTLFPA